jgi:hypothetical protein
MVEIGVKVIWTDQAIKRNSLFFSPQITQIFADYFKNVNPYIFDYLVCFVFSFVSYSQNNL